MKFTKHIATYLVAVGLVGPLAYSQAEPVYAIKSGNDLQEVCHWDERVEIPAGFKNLYFGMCAGYITAVVDTESLTQVSLRAARTADTRKLRFCIEDSRITNAQLETTIKNFVTTHPEILHLSAASVVSGALSPKFVCK